MSSEWPTRGAAPPVHFYLPDGLTFAERILCRTPDQGLNTHVTEFGPQVTCPVCESILLARLKEADE